MTLKNLLKQLKTIARQKNTDLPGRHIEDWIGYVLKLNWSQVKTANDLNVDEKQLRHIRKGFEELLMGKPLAHLTGEMEFFGLPFSVNEHTLIPRFETEILVEQALALLEDHQVVFDLGAGTGCIGLSLAHYQKNTQVHLFEASEQALALCRVNAKTLSLSNVTFHHCVVGEQDLFNLPLADLIVANPPYIELGDPRISPSVHSFEPHQALYCGDGGLYWIKKWLKWGASHLKPGGFLICEFGQGQASEISSFIRGSDYDIIETIKDHAGIERFVKVKKRV